MGGSGGAFGGVLLDKSLKEFAETREIEIDTNRSIYLDGGKPHDFVEVYKVEPFKDISDFFNYTDKVKSNAEGLAYQTEGISIDILDLNKSINDSDIKTYLKLHRKSIHPHRELTIQLCSFGEIKTFYSIKDLKGLDRKKMIESVNKMSLESKLILGIDNLKK
jgi:hypothetical protein